MVRLWFVSEKQNSNVQGEKRVGEQGIKRGAEIRAKRQEIE